jgi:short subunit dehydrogenase-like uncharacterized protein
MEKKYDVVLYGASGFVGAQTAAYFKKHAPANVTWAIAGRNPQKLERVQRTFNVGKPVDVLVADSRDKASIEAIVKRTRVVLTTAGPFALYGENIIAACAKYGVDYVDITGEPVFIRDMIRKYEKQAKASGAKIIPFCGFDSVPSDLGVFIANNYIHEILKSSTRAAQGFFSIKGGFNGGTLATMLNMFESGAWKEMKDPAVLITDDSHGITLISDDYRVHYDRDVRKWTAPFMMGAINTRVVNRSAALFSRLGEGYGDNFQYSEYHKIGDWWNPLPAMAVACTLRTMNTIGPYRHVRKLLGTFGPAPGEGPSEDVMNNGYYSFEVIGTSWSGAKVRVVFSGDGDPGNRGTIRFLSESALCLVTDRDRLPGGENRTGFLTPAAGLGSVLVDRLKKAGISITVSLL